MKNETEIILTIRRQEDTIAQLMKIIAATNNRVFDLQMKYKRIEEYIQPKKN